MKIFKKELKERVLAVVLAAAMLFSVLPVGSLSANAAEPETGMGTVEGYTSATVTGSGTATMAVTVKDTTLTWSKADTSIGRNYDAWWAGVKVTAPTDVADLTNAKYQRLDFEATDWTEEKSFWANKDSKDGDTTHYIGMWIPLTPDLLEKYKDVDIVYQYKFDWEGDGAYDQTLTFTMDSSTIELKKVEQTGFSFADKNPGVQWNENGTYQNIASGGESTGAISYEITTGDDVATIDTEGKLTFIKDGTVAVKATKAGDDTYNAATAEYTVSFAAKAQEVLSFEKAEPTPVKYSKTLVFENVASGGSGTGAVTYKIDADAAKAEIDENTGKVSVYKPGTYTITATKAATVPYKEATATYTLQVEKGTQEIAFDKSVDKVYYGATEYTNNVAAAVGEVSETTGIKYSIAENEDGLGVSVDETTGEVKIVDATSKVGSVVIKAEKAGDDCYEAATAVLYTLTIEYIATPSDAYTLLGDQKDSESGWYTGDITINPASGYQISYSDKLTGNTWNPSVIYTTEGTDQSTKVYLKDANGAITDAVDVTELNLDKQAPKNLKITYGEETLINKILEAFGFYKDSLEVTVEAEDDISKVDSFTWFYERSSDASTSNVDKKEGTITRGDEGFPMESNKATFTLTGSDVEHYRGNISFEVKDVAGNVNALGDNGYTVVVDAKEPVLSNPSYTNPQREAEGTDYYNQDVLVGFDITEVNFYEEDVIVDVTKDGQPYPVNVTWETVSEKKDTYHGEFNLSEEGGYEVKISYTDKSGKEMSTHTSREIIIDKTSPVVDVEYTNKDVKKVVSEREYYNASQTATITITEKNFRANEVALTVEAKDATEKDVYYDELQKLEAYYTEYAKDQANWKVSGDVNTLIVPFSKDANYTFDIVYEDLATNKAADYVVDSFTVDTVASENLTMKYGEPAKLENVIKDVLSAITFGFYKNEVTVTMTAEDKTAGNDFFTINATKKEIDAATNITLPEDLLVYADGTTAGTQGGLTEITASQEDGKMTVSFKVPAQYKGQFDFTATDLSSNASNVKDRATVDAVTDVEENYVAVVDNIAPTRTVSYSKAQRVVDAVTLLDVTDYKEGDNVIAYYNDKAEVTLDVEEANFYAEDVVVKVTKDSLESDASIVWQDSTDENHRGSFTLTEEGDYTVNVTYTDRSTNEMVAYASHKIVIDKTAPTVDVQYDNKDVKDTVDGRQYFNNKQTATITVKEHNFRADNIVVVVTAVDAAGNKVSNDSMTLEEFYLKYGSSRDNWTDYETGWRRVDDTYQLKVTYGIDANYTFDIAYADLATNAASDYVVDSFTVDTVAPENLTMKYGEPAKLENVIKDVLSAITFGFYKNDVTVTMTAEDKTAGNDFFTINATKKEIDAATNIALPEDLVVYADGTTEGTPGSLTEITASQEDGKMTVSFKVPAQYKGQFDFTATDLSSNESSAKDTATAEQVTDVEVDYVAVVDNINPKRSVSYSEPQGMVNAVDLTDVEKKLNEETQEYYYDYKEGDDVIAYYNDKAVVTLDVIEANFYAGDVIVKVVKDGNESDVPIVWQDSTNENHRGTFTLTEEGDYTVKVTYTDRSTNEMMAYASHKIVIDKTAPIVDVEYSEEKTVVQTMEDNDGNMREYLDKETSATITIEEHNFRPDDVKIIVTALDSAGNKVSNTVKSLDEFYKEFGCDRANWTPYEEEMEVTTWRRADDTFEINIEYAEDANYTFDVTYADLATNAADYDADPEVILADYAPDYFTVDTKAPYGLKVAYSTNVFETIISTITFGYYDAQMTVTITAQDDTAGVWEYIYSYIKAEGVSEVNAELLDDAIYDIKQLKDGDKWTNIYEATFEIPKDVLQGNNQFRGTVAFNATDRSLNHDEENDFADTTTIVVDNIKPVGLVTFNDPLQKVNDISYYEGNVDATIKINEANFYSEDVVVTVTKDNQNYPVNVTWTDENVDNHTGTFTLTEDGHYIVNVTYADRSTNEMENFTSNQLTIDTKEPVITMSNIEHQSANNAEKIGFTLSITDMNIGVENLQPRLTANIKKVNEDGTFTIEEITIPLGNAVTTTNATGETVHTYTIDNLDIDGYYSLVCSVVDYAGHTVSVISAEGTNTPIETVNYSVNRLGSAFWIETEHNNKYTDETFKDALDGAYANDKVVVELHEVNVDEIDSSDSDEHKTLLQLNDGSETADITLEEGKNYDKNSRLGTGGWFETVYTLNDENFDHDGVYSFNITTYDKAENTNINTKSEEGTISFTLDRTNPTIASNIETDQRVDASEHTVEFKIIDANLDATTVTAKLNNKEVEVEEISEGTYKFVVGQGFRQDVEITAKDLAGNTAEEYEIEGLTVSTNFLVLWYADTVAFWGTIGGVLALTIAFSIIIILKRKKQQEEKK